MVFVLLLVDYFIFNDARKKCLQFFFDSVFRFFLGSEL